MSQESVAVVYQTLSAMMNVDHRQAAVNFAPDAEWHNTSAFPGARVCVGPDAILRFWEALVEAFAEGDAEIEQVSEGWRPCCHQRPSLGERPRKRRTYRRALWSHL